MTNEDQFNADIRSALLKVARRSAEYAIQQDEWEDEDPYVLTNLREAEEEIRRIVDRAMVDFENYLKDVWKVRPGQVHGM